MKMTVFLMISALLAGLVMITFMGCQREGGNTTVTISGAWALYPMAVRWQEEFRKVRPEVRIEVTAGGAGKGMSDVLSGLVDIASGSRDVFPAETEKGATAFAVARDAVVPTINAVNPTREELRRRGLSREECRAIWIGGTVTRWEQLSGILTAGEIRVYTRSDACGAGQVWAEYLGGTQDDLSGVRVYGDPGIAEAVVRDPAGVGFNNINFAYDPATLLPVPGLIVLTIDFNGNGQIDPEEDFTATRDKLTQAIRDGRFPSPPARKLFFVTRGMPEKTAVRDFLSWVLGDGQAFVEESGYIHVTESERKACLELLSGN